MRPRRIYDPSLTEPHFAVFLGEVLVRELEREHGAELVNAALEEAGLDREYLADPTRWMSIRFMFRFSGAILRRAFGVDDLPYHHPFWQVWRRTVQRTVAGLKDSLWSLFVWSLRGPARYFAAIDRVYRTHNTITRARFVAAGAGWSTVEFEELRPEFGRPAACWSRVGILETIPEIWGLPRARVEHTRCFYQSGGAANCEYTIHYDEDAGRDPTVELAAIAERMQASIPAMLADQERQFREYRLALMAQRKVAQYLPPTVVRRIEENPEQELTLGGRSCEGAVLFADICGYTKRSLAISPEATVEQLNLYFEHMDAVVAAHGGIVDKRIGDGMMVVFVDVEGASAREVLAAQAVRCGLAMLREMPACNAALAALTGEPLTIRVGVAAGRLVLGNIGSHNRMEHTVIGEPVNLAARLESAAAPGRLLTIPECVVAVPEVRGAIRRLEVKGFGAVAGFEIDPAYRAT